MNDNKESPIVDKEIVKQALRELLDEQLQAFGWFALKSIVLVISVGALYLWLTYNGWHK